MHTFPLRISLALASGAMVLMACSHSDGEIFCNEPSVSLSIKSDQAIIADSTTVDGDVEWNVSLATGTDIVADYCYAVDKCQDESNDYEEGFYFTIDTAITDQNFEDAQLADLQCYYYRLDHSNVMIYAEPVSQGNLHIAKVDACLWMATGEIRVTDVEDTTQTRMVAISAEASFF
jgi:hypothetical protein